MTTDIKKKSTVSAKTPVKVTTKPEAKRSVGRPAKPVSEKPVKTPRIKIGDIAYALIREGKLNNAIIKEIKKAIPDAKPTDGSINWYRTQLRNKGETVKSSRQAVEKKAASPKKAAEKPVAKSMTKPAVKPVAKTEVKPSAKLDAVLDEKAAPKKAGTFARL